MRRSDAPTLGMVWTSSRWALFGRAPRGRTLHETNEESQRSMVQRGVGVGHCKRGSLAGLLQGQQRRHFQLSEGGAGQTRHRRDQGHRGGRVHLRLADRDELRGDVRVLRGHELRPIQGPVQPDLQRSPCLHVQGHGRSSRPTATRPIPCSGWICAPSRSCCRFRPWRRSRYYSVQLCDGNTFNYGYIGSRATGNEAGDYHGGRPRLERRDARRHQEGLPFEHAILARRPSARSSSMRTTCRTWSRSRLATRRSRSQHISISPRHRLPPPSTSPRSTRKW